LKLAHYERHLQLRKENSSIHPQGWVPIETIQRRKHYETQQEEARSIHPQGWVPIETGMNCRQFPFSITLVAFTPKGGCPLKPYRGGNTMRHSKKKRVAFTPKGGCPLKRSVTPIRRSRSSNV